MNLLCFCDSCHIFITGEKQMNSCVAASEAVAPAKPAWRAVYSLGLGVFGLITAE
ncbi:MFS transporter, partial [Raoultella ornithinolytica]